VSDANGIVEFGDIDPTATPTPEFPKNTTISFVLTRTQSPAAQAVVSLVDIPIAGDVKFNVALNNFDDLNLDLTVRAQVTGQFPQELFCSSDLPATDCPAVLFGSGGSVQPTFAPFTNQVPGVPGLTSIGPMDIYQLQNDSSYSLGAIFSNLGSLSCFVATPEPSASGTIGLSETLTIDAFYQANPSTTTLFFEKQSTLHKGSVIEQPLLVPQGSQSLDQVFYCPTPNGQPTKISFVDTQDQGRRFSTFSPGVGSQLTPTVTIATNDISVLSVTRPAIDQIAWTFLGNPLIFSSVVSIEQRWQTTIQLPSSSPSVVQLRRYTLVQPGATSAVLPILPSDLSYLDSLPDGTTNPISTTVAYNGFTPALGWDNVWRRLFGGTGAYLDIDFDGLTTNTHKVAGILDEPLL
jgi:hypothetical protein